MTKVNIKNGFIVYRKPNIAEKMILLGELGFTESELTKFQDAENGNDSPEMYIFMGKALQKLANFISEVNVDHQGKKISEYEELLHHEEYTEDIIKLSMTLFGVEVEAEKKPVSKK